MIQLWVYWETASGPRSMLGIEGDLRIQFPPARIEKAALEAKESEGTLKGK